MPRNEALLREILSLSLEERADVATQLLASLDDPPDTEADAIDREWGAEVERRARRVLNGDSPGIRWPEVARKVKNRLTEQ
jgi:hypothetical protein